ncbi:MAG: hypothetical protein KatS3mg047_0455 [Bellilinea sp.]|nr:MAG: hypothetical protein KatS3mg047_0455 [Bellilinea sp.]
MSNNDIASISPNRVRRVYICGNGKCIHRSAAESVFNHLLGLIRTHQMDNFEAPYRVKCQLAGCLDICTNGVTLVVQPDSIYYWNIDEEKAEKIFFQHLINNQPIEEFRYQPNP